MMSMVNIKIKEMDFIVCRTLPESLKQIEKVIKWPLRSNLKANRFCLMLNGKSIKPN